MVGYCRPEIMHKHCDCSFLYGADTDPEAIKQLAAALVQCKMNQQELCLRKKNSKYTKCLDKRLGIWKQNFKLVNSDNRNILHFINPGIEMNLKLG